MKRNVETVVIDDIKYTVLYQYQIEKEHYEEPTNIASFVPATVDVRLAGVGTPILGKPTDILCLLNKEQKELIISKLTYGNE